MIQDRKIWVDWIRVTSVFLVILLHACSRYFQSPRTDVFDFMAAAFYRTVSSPCVPLLIMISGYLLLGKQESDRKIIDRVKRLVVPLLLWSIIYSFYPYQSIYYSSNNEKVDFLESLKLSLLAVQSPKAFHLWFLYMLTGLYFSLPVLRKFGSVLQDKTFIWLTGLTMINHLINSINPLVLSRLKVEIGWTVGINFATFFLYYFLAGYCLGYQSWLKYKFSSLLKLAGSLLITTYLITLIVRTRNIPFDAIGFFVPFLALTIFSIFQAMETEKPLPWSLKLAAPINFLAHQSYSIYLIHLITLDLVMFALEKTGIIQLSGLWISIPLAAIAAYLLSIAFLSTIRAIFVRQKWLNWLFP